MAYRMMPIANQLTGYKGKGKKHDVFTNDKRQRQKEIERLQQEYARRQTNGKGKQLH